MRIGLVMGLDATLKPWVLAAACALAGCGGDGAPPSTSEVAQCLREEGASVEMDPEVSGEGPATDFPSILSPGTELVARGDWRGTTTVDVLISPSDEVEHAEEQAVDFVRLFGQAREDVMRRGTMMLVINGSTTRDDEERPEHRAAARRCLEDA